MSTIEKLDSARIQQEKIPFTMHHNYVLQNLRDPLSLAIWCYLTSLPNDWKIHRTYLMAHFGVGRDKLAKALKLLASSYLLEYVQERNESGIFGEAFIRIKCGYEFTEHHKKLSTETNTAPLKIRATEKPDTGKTATTKEIFITKKNKKTKREALSGFEPDEANTVLAKDLSVDLAQELQSFKERHKGKKTQYEFSRWLKHAKEYQSSKKVNNFKQIEPYSAVNNMGFHEASWKEEAIKKDLQHEPKQIEKLMPFKEAIKLYKEKQGCNSNDKNKTRDTTRDHSR